MSSIAKRSGKYRVLIRRTGQPTISKTFVKKSDAATWARKTESEIERGLYIDDKLAQQTTVREILDRYRLEILPTKKSNGSSEISRINLLKLELGHYKLSDLKPYAVTKFKDKRLKVGLSSSTVKRELSLLSRTLNTAIKDWHYPIDNPVRKVRIPSESKGRTRRLEPEEEYLLLSALDKTIARDIVRFALETGMRRSEITSMDWKYVDLKKRTLYIPVTKTATPRTIPLSKMAISILRERMGNFGYTSGKIWDIEPHSVTRAFRRACKRKGIINLRLHDLRHEATTRFFEKGLNIMEVSSITGHRDLRMLKRYTHLRAEDLVNKLG